jgi:hypothetical protein
MPLVRHLVVCLRYCCVCGYRGRCSARRYGNGGSACVRALPHPQVDKFCSKTALKGCFSRYAAVYLRPKQKEQ